MGVIYKISFPSGKCYIGQTKRDLTKRIKEHIKRTDCVALDLAIKKYGPQSMEIEILLVINNNFLDEYEIKFIDIFDTISPNGYNIRSGGSKGFHNIESRERMRQSKLGEKNYNYGKPRTEETKRNISISKSGEKHHFFGKPLNQEHKQKLSIVRKKYDKSLPMYLVYIKTRPEYYQNNGYAVVNHPLLKTKYFTSKKNSLEKNKELALEYLNSVT